jgi:urea transport system substrate-binding protein
LAAWNYFESINTPANKAFIDQWHAFIKNPKRTTNDPMEAHYIGFNLWVKAVEKAKSTDVEKVLAALPGTETPNLTGGMAKVLPNHHITKPVFIGEVRADGQFNVVSKSPGLVPGDAWSDYLPGSKDIEADWVTLKCGNYNKVTKKCSGQNYK